MGDEDEALEAFMALYRYLDGGCITVVYRTFCGSRRTKSYLGKVEYLPNVAKESVSLCGSSDVYFNLASHKKAPTPPSRGGEDLAHRSFFAFLDLDISADVHSFDGLCTDIDSALSLLDRFLEPTLVVDSGYGIHAYWRFSEPVNVESHDGVLTCKTLLRRIHEAFRTQDINPMDFKIDPIADLARYLRVPGTVSWKNKSDPRPVKILKANHETEYSFDFLCQVLDALEVKIPVLSSQLLGRAEGPARASNIGLDGKRYYTSPSKTQDYQFRLRRAYEWINARPPGVSRTGNGRNRYTYTTVCFLAGHPLFLLDEDVLEIMIPWGEACDPPYSEKEIREKLRDARKNGCVCRP